MLFSTQHDVWLLSNWPKPACIQSIFVSNLFPAYTYMYALSAFCLNNPLLLGVVISFTGELIFFLLVCLLSSLHFHRLVLPSLTTSHTQTSLKPGIHASDSGNGSIYGGVISITIKWQCIVVLHVFYLVYDIPHAAMLNWLRCDSSALMSIAAAIVIAWCMLSWPQTFILLWAHSHLTNSYVFITQNTKHWQSLTLKVFLKFLKIY